MGYRDVLPAKTLLFSEDRGAGREKVAIRRAMLVDRKSGLLYELPTVFIYNKRKFRGHNTQTTTLRELAFYLAWCDLQKKINHRWITPEQRLKEGKQPLTAREVCNLGDWCQYDAPSLAKQLAQWNSKLSALSKGRPVEVETANRRLGVIRDYLSWLTTTLIEGRIQSTDLDLAKSTVFLMRLNERFADELHKERKPSPVRSLNGTDDAKVKDALKCEDFYPRSACGNRDRLIVFFLRESGLRAGELLKVKTTDLNSRFEVEPGKYRAVIKVERRPNEAADVRTKEPLVKTEPGQIVLPASVATALMEYIRGDRRLALDRQGEAKEHPYIFVNHEGKYVGRPLSQRNLIRIIGKLQDVPNLAISITAHVFRHTHLTDLADTLEKKGLKEYEIKAHLINRGRWAEGSEMPARYTGGRTRRQETEIMEERERRIVSERE